MTLIRLRDKRTGHEFTGDQSLEELPDYTPLDKPAVDRDGRALNPVFRVSRDDDTDSGGDKPATKPATKTKES